MSSSTSSSAKPKTATASSEAPREMYPSGHQPAVLSSHKWRTVDNSAYYALPALRKAFTAAGAGATMLDVGCGPGTITAGFGSLAAPTKGKVIGIDFEAVLPEARKHAEEKGVSSNTTFEAGNVFKLHWADNSFIAAHTHQVLIHLTDPVSALKEIRRVLTKQGSVLAVREADFGAIAIHPMSEGLQLYLDVWHKVSRAAGGEPNAGRRLKNWALAAGFKEEHMTFTSRTFCYSTPTERKWWGELWASRMSDPNSNFVKSALERGFATQAQLDQIGKAWIDWSNAPDATYILAHGELLVQQ